MYTGEMSRAREELVQVSLTGGVGPPPVRGLRTKDFSFDELNLGYGHESVRSCTAQPDDGIFSDIH